MAQPLVSIIVVNYNGLKYLQRTLPAILALRYRPLEILIIDGLSTDGSADFLRANQGVKLLLSRQKGSKSAAANFGAEAAQGDFLLFLDNDVIIRDDDLIAKLIGFAETKADAAFVSLANIEDGESSTISYGGFVSFFLTRFNRRIRNEKVFQFHGQVVSFPHGNNFFCRRSVWRQLGGYDERLPYTYDDVDIGVRAFLFGYKNYLFAESYNRHIGWPEKAEIAKYAGKYRNLIAGGLNIPIKYYTGLNLLFFWPILFLFFGGKTIKQSLSRRSVKILTAYLGGLVFFVRMLPTTLKIRRYYQKNRTIKKDSFLFQKPYNLNQ